MLCYEIKNSYTESKTPFDEPDTQREKDAELEENIRKLSMQGYRIGLDGFGKGYSDIGHLIDLPVESVRLDKGMLQMTFKEKGKAMLAGCIRMLRGIPLSVIADGVDDEETAEMLRGMGCDMIQGDYKPGNTAGEPETVSGEA